jgi:hypothetical protein
MLRPAVKILVVVAVIWGLWWAVATSALKGGIAAWMDARSTSGLQIEAGEIVRAGFPLRIASTVADVSVTGSNTLGRSVLQMPRIGLSTPIYWPGEITLQLPDSPITLSTPADQFALMSEGFDATLRLHPGPSLQLDFLSAASARVTVDHQDGLGRVLGIEKLDAHIRQSATPVAYDIGFTAAGVELGPILTSSFDLPSTWPPELGPVFADMQVIFDRPWDRTARQGIPPQPRLITVETISASYAGAEISVGGVLNVDAAGILSGSLRLQLKNWHNLFDLAEASPQGVPQWVRPVQNMLGFISQDQVEQIITIEQGQMRMGFIPLGLAPVLRFP